MNATVTVYIDGYKTDFTCEGLDETNNLIAEAKSRGWSYTWTDFDKTKSPAKPVTFQTGSQRMLEKKAEQQECPHPDSFEFVSKYPPTIGKRMKKCNTCGKSWVIDKWQEAQFNDPARNGF